MAVWLSIQVATLLTLACNIGTGPTGFLVGVASYNNCTCFVRPFEDRSYRNGSWYVSETQNFQVCCKHADEATKLARYAETLRDSLSAKWLGQLAPDEWHPKCRIILYTSRRDYVAAVGHGSERTVGSSLINVDSGRIITRRIDLLGESNDYFTSALPHELTHVVLKDRFVSGGLPRWADEGMATLADTEAKQKRHENDLRRALRSQTTFHSAELLLMEDYPAVSQFGTFYGQSVSLTEFLVERQGPTGFVNFIQVARQHGFDNAARECYGFANLGDLDLQWRQSIAGEHTTGKPAGITHISPSSSASALKTASLVSR